MEFLTEPVSHDEAADFIKQKPAVARAVFDNLLPELKARAFTVAGLEQANELQAVRDLIAEIPQGGDWDKIKHEIAAQISPYFVDPDADPEEQALQVAAGDRRAELLLRLHGFQAYSSAAYRALDEQRDVFPYWQYKSMGDGKVRHTHRALHDVALPAGDPFWNGHYPPWEWGCRCQVVGLMDIDVREIREADKGKPLEKQRIIEGEARRQLVEGGRLVRGPTEIFDVRTPVQKGQKGAFSWNPGDMHLPLEAIKARYDAPVWAAFEAWAKAAPYQPTGETIWNWLEQDPAWRLLHRRDVPSHEAAKLLATAPPDHPVAQAVRTWGDDQEAFQRLMSEDSDLSRTRRAIIESLLAALAPMPGQPTLYRGWLDRAPLVALERDGAWIQARTGMSASASTEIAAGRFLTPSGMLWEIRAAKTARDLSPIFAALGTRYAHEQEAVFPEHCVFRLISIADKNIAPYGNIPYIVVEQIIR